MISIADTDWLEIGSAADIRHSTVLPTAPIMQRGAFEGRDRKWYTDGQHIWFRRSQANPETVSRHNRFMAAGDYEYLGTNDDVEVYRLKDQSRFKVAGANTRVVDMDKLWSMGTYQVYRLAAISACERKWETFSDILGYIRQKFQQIHVGNAAAADLAFGEFTEWLQASIIQRLGPSWGEIQKELNVIASKRKKSGLIITLGAR